MNRKHTLPKRLNSNKEANRNSGTEVLNKRDEECSRKDWEQIIYTGRENSNLKDRNVKIIQVEVSEN